MKKMILPMCVLTASILMAGCQSTSSAPSELANCNKASYSAIFMSDTHYDKRKYDTNTNLPAYWVSEADRNYKMWDNGVDSASYKMLDQIAAAKDDTTAFIIHGGDIIQGDFDSPEATAMATKDAIDDITSKTGLPLYFTTDNHDSSRYMGTEDPNRYPTYGAPQDNDNRDGKPVRPTTEERATHEAAFLNVAQEYTKTKLGYDKFEDPYLMTKVYNKDLYIFTRATVAGIQYLDKELARFPKKDVRYTFVIIHLPPMLGKAYGESKPWQVDSFSYYTDNPRVLVVRDAVLKEKVMEELANREAIVLCGHKHFWEKIDAKFPKGVIHQLMINSNITDYSKKWTECRSFDDFAAHAAKEGKGSILDVAGAEKVLDYRLFSDCGFVKLRISDEGVYADAYSCNQDGKKVETLKLR